MQRRRGLPSHLSLPPNPQLYRDPEYISQQNVGTTQPQPTNIGALAARALTSTLANPYGSNPYSYTNANYHAYFTQTQHPATTPQGYTLSSTYVAHAGGPQSQPQATSWPQTERGRPPTQRVGNHVRRDLGDNSFSAPGDTRCTHPGCSFTGTKKTVEIHMMDRHLIFPPGWKKRRPDWDADPSLKGKPVPIPGTGVLLNTPEAIDAWIAERRKKWPTSQRIEDKKRTVQEAANRGEIDPSELTARGHKRRRLEDDSPGNNRRCRGQGRGRGGKRGDWRSGKTDSGWRGRGRGGSTMSRIQPVTGTDATRADDCGEGDNPTSSSDKELSDSGSDMDPVKDAVSSKAPNHESDPRILKKSLGNLAQQIMHDDDPYVDEHVASSRDLSGQGGRPPRRQQIAQPKVLPPNPFATRPSLLRSLLLPEIRHTVSNLSQAIHFLVENDFLEGVELTPGESDSQPIKVLRSSSTERPDAQEQTTDAIQE